MVFLLVQLGQDHYALDSRQIVEVLPLVNLKRIPQTPPGVAGAFDYRGSPVPVIDLSELMMGRPSLERWSTRLVLAHYSLPSGEARILGLIAERVTETFRREPGDFVSLGVTVDRAPYLGPVASDERGLVQWIDIGKLLPEAVREMLFRETIAPNRTVASGGTAGGDP
jgi:chemotaxis-related protein WspB